MDAFYLGPSHTKHYEKRLASALRRRGWSVHPPPKSRGQPVFGLLAEHGSHRYVIEFKLARESRRETLQALLADAILRARSAASEVGAKPLAVVAAPQLSGPMREALRDYVRAFAPGQAFGYLDGRGLVYFAGEGLDGDWDDVLEVELPAHAPQNARWNRELVRARARPRNAFSDSNQWMLKVLLGQRLSPEHVSVPKARIDSPSALAKTAGVSLPSAWRFVQMFSDDGFLEKGPRELQLVRIAELLQRWRAASLTAPRQVQMSWALRTGEPLEQLTGVFAKASSASSRMCVGLFSACDLLGLGFVRGATAHLYVPEHDLSFLDGLGLVPSSPGRPADVLVRVPRWRESVFRARVRRSGAWASDVIQCWLDVSHEASRGSEQAEFLWRRAIAPGLGLSKASP